MAGLCTRHITRFLCLTLSPKNESCFRSNADIKIFLGRHRKKNLASVVSPYLGNCGKEKKYIEKKTANMGLDSMFSREGAWQATKVIQYNSRPAGGTVS